MSQLRILIGAVVVIALLLTVPIVGVVALVVCLVGGLFLWIADPHGSRPCPVCGEPVKNGVTQCQACGHDFRAAAERD